MKSATPWRRIATKPRPYRASVGRDALNGTLARAVKETLPLQGRIFEYLQALKGRSSFSALGFTSPERAEFA
ncbi:MAG: hypothetical protein JST14_00005 [Bacteroidetes bacterium]|nr:hypothetical protein [Bacteroidota bacterium]